MLRDNLFRVRHMLDAARDLKSECEQLPKAGLQDNVRGSE